MDNEDELRIPFDFEEGLIPLSLYNQIVDIAERYSMTVEEVLDLAMETYSKAHPLPPEAKLPPHKQAILDAKIAEARRQRDAGIQTMPVKHMKLFE